MLDLNELEQLIAFSDAGTLSRAACQLHISQPTITRTMQHLEEVFGVPLFLRGKNKIVLNETGQMAVKQARLLLSTADSALKSVREFDQHLHTITVSSCAPAPLWYILPTLSRSYSHMTIASSIKEIPSILEELHTGTCQLAILPSIESSSDDPNWSAASYLSHFSKDNYINFPFLEEHLSVCIPPSHKLAQKSSVTFADLNGFNFLLRSEIGFWDGMCRIQMPASRFLVQSDEFEFQELIRQSSLPYFTTDLANHFQHTRVEADRVAIPIQNPEANVTYCLLCLTQHKDYASCIQPLS